MHLFDLLPFTDTPDIFQNVIQCPEGEQSSYEEAKSLDKDSRTNGQKESEVQWHHEDVAESLGLSLDFFLCDEKHPLFGKNLVKFLL